MSGAGNSGTGQGRRSFGGGGAGPSGECVCIKCGYTSPKKRGIPCLEEKCPHCGAILLRKGGTHYQNAVKKR